MQTVKMRVAVVLKLAVLLQSSLPAGFLFENHLWFVIVHLNLINQSDHLSSIYLACSQTTSIKDTNPGVAGEALTFSLSNNNAASMCHPSKISTVRCCTEGNLRAH